MANCTRTWLGAGWAFAENDHAQNLILGHFVRTRCADNPSVLHDREAIGEVEHILDVMADQKNADAFLLQLDDEISNLRRFFGAEYCGRLIHDVDAGIK